MGFGVYKKHAPASVSDVARIGGYGNKRCRVNSRIGVIVGLYI